MTEREKFICLVDNDRPRVSNAIVLLEGDGLNRAERTAQLFNQGMAKWVVFSGGIEDPGYGSYRFERVLPTLKKLGIPEDNIIPEEKSLNTHDQANEVIRIMIANRWNRIILVASHYHQYRAYLTFLAVAQNLKVKPIIYNAPAKDLPWFEVTDWGTRLDLLEKEFKKIEIYRAKGHVASYGQAIGYQRWKESQG